MRSTSTNGLLLVDSDELERLDPVPVCVAVSGKLSPTAVDAYRRISKSPLLVKPVHRAQVDALLREHWRSERAVADSTEPILTRGA